LLIAGYAAAWALFGLVAHGFDAALHCLADRLPLLLTHGWLIVAAIVAIAGVYQFGSLTYRCLDNAASITGHWRGLSARRASLLLGVNHGAFCIGCC
jgi:predicted metal-binding membrane protein